MKMQEPYSYRGGYRFGAVVIDDLRRSNGCIN